MKLSTVLTTTKSDLNQPAPQQTDAGPCGLPVRTNLRAGNLVIGIHGSSHGEPPSHIGIGIGSVDGVA